MKIVQLLGYQKEDVTALDVDNIYKQYGVNLNNYQEIKLEEERK